MDTVPTMQRFTDGRFKYILTENKSPYVGGNVGFFSMFFIVLRILSGLELGMCCAQPLKRQWPIRRSFCSLLKHPGWLHKNQSQEALGWYLKLIIQDKYNKYNTSNNAVNSINIHHAVHLKYHLQVRRSH